MKPTAPSGYVQVRGAREHNLKNVDVDIPRDALVVFTGVSGSGKSSLAFGTLYAEAQRRYFESVAPYARRLIDQVGVPDVDSIEGLPPAVALQQQRGTPSTRSSVGSVTTLGSLVRMLYSRAGAYPPGQAMLYAEDFSANTPQGACPHCHGLGRVYEVTEKTMVPDDSLTIRQRAVASWPPAWQGQNQRDILVTLGYDVDVPWRDLPKKQRDWILFTEETPTVPVYGGMTPAQTRDALKRKLEPSYQGTFTGARRYVLHTFTHSQSALMKKRVSQFMIGAACEVCAGKRLKPEALGVTFAGLDIGEFSRLPLTQLAQKLKPVADGKQVGKKLSEEKRLAAEQLAQNLLGRLNTLIDLGLGYLALERSTPTLSSGELQRLRLATQLGSQLFGVVYVLDEPTAGLHPADGESLHAALQGLKAAGNSLFVVEHDLDTMSRADWVVDVGPLAGEQGGQVLYSGPPKGLAQVDASQTRAYLYGSAVPLPRPRRPTASWLKLADVSRNNLHKVAADFPLQCFTAVTGISGSGKSSLVSQVLLELVGEHLGQAREDVEDVLEDAVPQTESGYIVEGMHSIKRLVQVDQKPIGRTPRSNLATYTGLFDAVRKLFAATPDAQRHGFDAGQFSFNVAKGRCPECEGEGFVSVELLFMPSVFSPCPTCHGARYSPKTLAVKWQGRSIADVLQLTVHQACEVFAEQPAVLRPLTVLRDIGLGYLRLGQPATELSGGEAQRIKLATELQRNQRGATLYVLDEPTTGLHPSDVDRLMQQLNHLVDAGNSVIVVEHDMRVVAQADWVIDIGPKAGDQGGKVVAAGRPEDVAKVSASRTAAYLQSALAEPV